MDVQKILDETKRAFRRFVRSDFQQERASDAEREALVRATAPVTEPQVQDYAAWRRSLLWVAGVALCLVAAFEMVTFESREDLIRGRFESAVHAAQARGAVQDAEKLRDDLEGLLRVLGRTNLETIDGILTFLHVPVLVGGILALVAAARWADVRRSRRLARLGFLLLFVTPFALAALPVKDILDFGHLDAAAQKEVAVFLGAEMGMTYFLLIGPRAIALFPGIIRSSMTLKTLVPESPMTGWAAALVAPLYSIFLLVVFSLVNQAYGSFLLLVGLGCLMVSPLVYILKAREVLRPHEAGEVTRVLGRIRRTAAIFNGLGVVLLAIWMIDVELFGFTAFLRFFLSVLGNVILLTVVGSDFLLAVIRAGHSQSRDLFQGPLEAPLERRFAAFSAAGFTDLRAKDAPTPDAP